MNEPLEVRIINLIRTVDQKWLSQVSQCVTEQDYDRLEIMLSPESGDYRDLLNGTEDSSIDDEFTELINEQVGAVKAVGSVARAVLDPRMRNEQVDLAIEAFENNGVLSTTKGIDFREKELPASSPVIPLKRILLNSNRNSASFVLLLAMHIVGKFPRPEVQATEVNGLLKIKHAELDSEPAIGVTLKLELLKDGPVGLHPDPRSMTFTKCSSDFISSLNDVWRNSELSKIGACVVWSLTEGSSTLSKIEGKSLGLAFAVGLTELVSSATRKVRFRRINAKCAFTGQVIEGKVREVEHYQEKIQAAVDHRWYTVVVPSESKSTVDKMKPEYFPRLKVRYASSVGEAVRNARKWNINVVTLVSIFIVIALTVSGWGFREIYQNRILRMQRIHSVSTELINRSEGELESNPRLAALAALASYRLEPSLESAEALRQVSEKYASVVGTAKASEREITKVTHAAKYVVGSDVNGRVSVCRDDMICVSSLDLNGQLSFLEGSTDGQLVIAVVHSSAVFLSLSEDGKVTESSRVDIGRDVNGVNIELVSVLLDSDNDVRFVYRDGVVDRYDASAKQRDSVDLHSIVDANSSQDVEYTSATPYLGGLLTRDSCDDNCILVGDSAGQVSLYDGRRQLLSMVGKLQVRNESIIALACDDESVVAATSSTVEVLDQQSKSMSSINLRQLPGRYVHDVRLSMRGQVVVLMGGVLKATTASYFSEGNRASPTQNIAATSIGVGGNMLGMVAGTPDGRLVMLDDYNNRTVMTKMVATTALAATGDKEFIQTIGLDPMKITGLRFVELDDSPKGYKVTQTIQSPGEMGKTGAYVNDIDVNGKYVAASGLTDDGRSGSIVVWERVSGKVVSNFRFGGWVKNVPPIISTVRLLGDTGLVAGIDSASASLVVFKIDGDGNPIAVRKLKESVLGMAYSEEQSSVFILNSEEPKGAGSRNELLSIDASSGVTKWKMDVGRTERIAVSATSDEIVGIEEDVITVYSMTDHLRRRQGRLPEFIDGNGGDIFWSPDGSKIAYVGNNGGIIVVDSQEFAQVVPTIKVENGKEIASFSWRSDSNVIAISTIKQFSSGDRAGDDTYVARVDASGWSARMCEIAGQGFTSEEWDVYVGNVSPYESLC